MADRWLDCGGCQVAIEDLVVPRATALARHLLTGNCEFARLVECRREEQASGVEWVVAEVNVEVPQVCRQPIEPLERIAVGFSPADDRYPRVLALRGDFPRVPHLVLQEQDLPRGLCLYDEPYDQVKLCWTPYAMVSRIQWWLSGTAKGTLHADDQELEPILAGWEGTLILPPGVFERKTDSKPEVLRLEKVGDDRGRPVFRGKRPTDSGEGNSGNVLALVLATQPVEHGIIERSPESLSDLHGLLGGHGVDLLSLLRGALKDELSGKGFSSLHVLLVVLIPKVRRRGGQPESSDVWAFCLGVTIQQLGEMIGVWELRAGERGCLIGFDESRVGSEVRLGVLRPVMGLSRDGAAAANGSSPCSERHLCIGVGALGSQVLLNLVRSGFGTWTCVDEDVFLPHNAARHVLPGFFAGASKALAVAGLASDCLGEAEAVKGLQADILHPGAAAGDLQVTLSEASAVVDMSTSIPVARWLARDGSGPGRRVSCFLSPRGLDLVVLAEDAQRAIRLDALEMQYYRAVLEDERLATHLEAAPGAARYSRGCRDVSRVLPQDFVAVHAGLGSRRLRQVLEGAKAAMTVFQIDEADLSVGRLELDVQEPMETVIEGWSVVWDLGLLARARDERATKLPNETGGIILGCWDVSRRVVYAVTVLPSPADSTERPAYFTRGREELRVWVDQARKRTGGMVTYVGEWHSHPDSCSCWPSEDDRKVLDWQAKNMSAEGLPGMMLVLGEIDYSWSLAVNGRAEVWASAGHESDLPNPGSSTVETC